MALWRVTLSSPAVHVKVSGDPALPLTIASSRMRGASACFSTPANDARASVSRDACDDRTTTQPAATFSSAGMAWVM